MKKVIDIILNILTFGQFLYKRYKFINEELIPLITDTMKKAEKSKGEQALNYCLSTIKFRIGETKFRQFNKIIRDTIEDVIKLSKVINYKD